MPRRYSIFINTIQNICLPVIGMLLLPAVNGVSAQVKYNQPPNIIFFLIHDLGYTDVGVFAKHITGVALEKQFYVTPEMNKLSGEGLTFWQAYANPLCSPKRASVFTDKYASRLGFMTATGRGYTTFFARGMAPPKGFYQHYQMWADSIPIEQTVQNGYNTMPPKTTGEIRLDESVGKDLLIDGKKAMANNGKVVFPVDAGRHVVTFRK